MPPGIPFALPPGTMIAGYEIVRALGAGGFGITYEGYNRIIKRRVAIKEFFPRGMASREGATEIVFTQQDKEIAEWALKKFEESTGALAGLAHPHILQVLNYIASHGTGYMVMEHVDGETLDDWLKSKPSPPSLEDLRPILDPILDALAYVHTGGMLHRDIAPDNIMIAKGGRPVLIDFGAIKAIEEQTRIKTAGSYAVGKRFYSPPEQLSGNAKLDARTDLYALAAVLYRALSGAPPEDADHRRAEVIDGGNDPYVSIAETAKQPLSAKAASVIDRALALRRDERPAGIADMRKAFGWSGTQGTEAPLPVTEVLPVTQPAPARGEERRNPGKTAAAGRRFRTLAMGAAAVTVVALTIGFSVFQNLQVISELPQPVTRQQQPKAPPAAPPDATPRQQVAPPPSEVKPREQVSTPPPAVVPPPIVPSQKWVPNKPITLVVPFAPGGGTDIIARALASKMQQSLGQPVIVENRPGALGAIAATGLARTMPDGYTLGFMTTGVIAINEWAVSDTQYNAERDFTYVALATYQPLVLVSKVYSSIDSGQGLIIQAKAKPGSLTYASTGSLSIAHLIGEHFKTRAGIDMTFIPYRSAADGIQDVIAGRVDTGVFDYASVRSFVGSGQLRIIGFAGIGDSAHFGSIDIANFLPGFDAKNWSGLVAPKGTPEHVVHTLAQSLRQALNDPDVRKLLEVAGAYPVANNQPDFFASLAASERKKWREIVQRVKN